MVSLIKWLLPAMPVIVEVAREVRRMREPAPPAGAATEPEALAAALARTTEALEQVSTELKRVQAIQAALERRLDVLGVVAWTTAGVLALVVVGLIVRLATL
jgi:hypothetical protein